MIFWILGGIFWIFSEKPMKYHPFRYHWGHVEELLSVEANDDDVVGFFMPPPTRHPTHVEIYGRRMEEICGGDTPYMSTNELLEQHDRCKSLAIREFRNAREVDGEFSLQFLERLESDLQESYEKYLKNNNSKNLFKSMRTPTVLVCLMIIDYICQEFFQLLGMNAIAGLFSSVLCIVIGALGVWAYSRYSGHLREAGGYVDDGVTYVCTNAITDAMRTPTVLVCLMIIDYICQEFFQLLGMNVFAVLFSSVNWFVIGTLGVWAYSRYSGHLREAGGYVDDGATYVWTNFMKGSGNRATNITSAIKKRQ